MTKGSASSYRADWKTPRALFLGLKKRFNFNFDTCPPNPQFDGLKIEWARSNYVNPPYGPPIKEWIKKAREESKKHRTVVMLIPSRTDTKYWHDYVMKAHEI